MLIGTIVDESLLLHTCLIIVICVLCIKFIHNTLCGIEKVPGHQNSQFNYTKRSATLRKEIKILKYKLTEMNQQIVEN